MNHLLRRVATKLRYRPVPPLISQTIQLDSIDTAVTSVLTWLADRVQWRATFLHPESKYIGLTVAKYGMLDLTFAVDGVYWAPEDAPGIPLLKELKFVLAPEDIPDLAKTDEDPTCLTQLDADINKNETLLRLCLRSQPNTPTNFTVIDACLTNAQFIWFHKHFYF